MEQLNDNELCKYCLGCEQIITSQNVLHCENFIKAEDIAPFYEALRKGEKWFLKDYLENVKIVIFSLV